MSEITLRSIRKIDEDISAIRELIRQYPNLSDYKKKLRDLRHERDTAAQQIGRKK